MNGSLRVKIIHIISPSKHKVHNWRIQVSHSFINLRHQSLDILKISIVITSTIIAKSFTFSINLRALMDRIKPPYKKTVLKLRFYFGIENSSFPGII